MRSIICSGLAAIALAGAMACGGDKVAGTSNPGTITISSTAIANQAGKFLVVFVRAEGQGTVVGRACIQIASNSFSAPATAIVDSPSGGTPCDPPGAAKSFAAGRYTLTAGIYVGGSQTAEKTTTLTVDVNGNVTASINGASLSQ